MAAILALILVPAIAAIGFMVLSNLDSPTTIAASLVFTALAMGVFGSMFRLMRRWEDEPS